MSYIEVFLKGLFKCLILKVFLNVFIKGLYKKVFFKSLYKFHSLG